MGRYYDQASIPDEMRRNFDVYDRITSLNISLGTFEENVVCSGEGLLGLLHLKDQDASGIEDPQRGVV